jgi:hypothetical protein
MTDEVLDRFADLDYPGKRKPVNRNPPKPEPETVLWDDKPLTYVVAGEKREFFTISHLAKALGYTVHSIRLWETRGVFPNAPYRSPRTKAPVAAGSTKGKRLWTRADIEAILRLAGKHRVILNREPPTPAFAKAVALELQRLQGDHSK